jgi:8-oxo-dGTP pyrophosphatase MutT (NUDIX family)
MVQSNLAKDEAFGIVPIQSVSRDYLFLLIQHHAGHWGFPKGHADPGETAIEAACREFREETGISDYRLLEGVSFSEHYTFIRRGQRFEKTVVYFPAVVRSAQVRFQQEEIQAYSWDSFEAAIARLTFAGARQVLTHVNQYLQQQGVRESPLW